MITQRQESTDLANLIRRHQDEIVTSWAEAVHSLPGTRYNQRSLPELRASASRGVEAVVVYLATGAPQALQAYLEDVSQACLHLQFEISEVIEALALLKAAALPVIRRAYPSEAAVDCRARYELVAHLDACLVHIVSRFSSLYAGAMEKELSNSKDWFRTVADLSYDWQYWLDPDGNYVYVSPSCERVTGYRADEFRQDPALLETIIHPDDRAAIIEHLRGEPLEGQEAHLFEFRVLTRDGEERWLEHACQPVYGSDGDYLGRRASNRDVTERRRAEEALKEQARERTLAAERSRLAGELHDSVTQTLYSVSLYVEATKLALSAGQENVAADNLEELHRMAREAIIDMRMLIFELRPPGLEEEGLAAALQARLSAVEARAGLQTQIELEEERRLPLAIEEELFWIAVEAFNNVVKHAQAQQVTVRLRFGAKSACLEIEDDGVGFDPAQARQSGGLGLRGIQERVERLDGTLEMTSAPDQGTTVRVRVAL